MFCSSLSFLRMKELIGRIIIIIILHPERLHYFNIILGHVNLTSLRDSSSSYRQIVDSIFPSQQFAYVAQQCNLSRPPAQYPQ